MLLRSVLQHLSPFMKPHTPAAAQQIEMIVYKQQSSESKAQISSRHFRGFFCLQVVFPGGVLA